MAHKVKVQNNAKGGRGGHFGTEPFEIAAGASAVFDGVSDGDLKMLVAKRNFRVQTFEDGAWVDQSNTELPAPKPWLAIGSGAKGERMRAVPLNEGEWFVGTALSSDMPESAAGYEWVKVGGQADEFVPVTQTIEVSTKRRVSGGEALAPVGGETEGKEAFVPFTNPGAIIPLGEMKPAFNPTTYVNDLMPDVIAGLEGKTPEQLTAILAAENAREKPRKGVASAVEEMLGKANGSEDNA